MADARDWAGELGAKWASQIDPMDRMLDPATRHAIEGTAHDHDVDRYGMILFWWVAEFRKVGRAGIVAVHEAIRRS